MFVEKVRRVRVVREVRVIDLAVKDSRLGMSRYPLFAHSFRLIFSSFVYVRNHIFSLFDF